MNEYWQTGTSRIHYHIFGRGRQLLFAFHGFDEEAARIEWLEPALGSRYTVVAIDIPFHGKTEWNANEKFSAVAVAKFVFLVMKRFEVNRFSMLGNSLGAKVVLAMVPLLSKWMDEIILLAPDGLKRKTWYDLAVYPAWGRNLFQRFIEKPEMVYRLAKILMHTGIISEKLFRYLQVQTATRQQRQKIFDTWMVLSELKVNLPAVVSALNDGSISCFIFIGRFDRVISVSRVESFLRKLNHGKLFMLQAGHQLITQSFHEELVNTWN